MTIEKHRKTPIHLLTWLALGLTLVAVWLIVSYPAGIKPPPAQTVAPTNAPAESVE